MRKIITFLGVKSILTKYNFGGKIYSGHVFAEALREIVDHDRMLVCVTDEANKVYSYLENLHDDRILKIPIPRGENTGEIWQIFDTILAQVNENDTVIFDITHGLRSLPFMVFLFASFLKSARHVTIEAIYYGAYELKDTRADNAAPVIDLSEFVSMIDWLTATDRFIQTGDSRKLAELLNSNGHSNDISEEASRKLQMVSQAALLCQPFKLMKSAPVMIECMDQAQQGLYLTAKPFRVLRDRIADTYQPMSGDPGDFPSVLRAEYEMIEWYMKSNQLIQAMQLAREWLIDAVTFKLGKPLDLKLELRSPIEYAISGVARVGRMFRDKESGERREFTPDDLNTLGKIIHDTWPEQKQLIELWDIVSPVRNTLSHAEHKADSMGLDKILEKSDLVMPLIRELAKTWGIIQ